MRSCLLDSPSSSTSALHTQAISPRRVIPARAISQQFDDSNRPLHPNGRRSSTRRAISRLSRLFHRVRDSFVARIPLWSPLGSPTPEPTPHSAPANLPIPNKGCDQRCRILEKELHQDQNLSDSENKAPQTSDLPSKIQNESNVDQFLITEDFHADGQPDCISVTRGERVELLDQFSSTDQDVIAVAVIDEFTNQPSKRRGNVPMKILFAIDGDRGQCQMFSDYASRRISRALFSHLMFIDESRVVFLKEIQL
ncbi:hypothetical protein FO519_006734 [Halicephalobus sp. NKZ332]|nr:hypothetical protein FO519_006734 [Halicephalobus sp. NKZ332]